jgi:hypothetical protein
MAVRLFWKPLHTAKTAAQFTNPVATGRRGDPHVSALSVTHWVSGLGRCSAPGPKLRAATVATARSRHRVEIVTHPSFDPAARIIFVPLAKLRRVA